MSKIRAYVSHSIRGKFGSTATSEQMEANNQKAIDFGKQLAIEFPNIAFYIPGAMDKFVKPAWDMGYLTIEQILNVDCDIISRCNFIVVFSPDDYISKGMKVEIDHAVLNKIHVIVAVDGSYEEYVQRIIYAINCHLVSMLR